LRRGRRTAHEALASHHRTSGWCGDADWFGKSAAIVAGDLAGVWAQQLFDSAIEGRLVAGPARAMFRALQVEAMTGQYVDLRAAQQRRQPASIEDRLREARRVALLKSGRYTVTRPLQLGAVVAGATTAQLATLETYGDAVGCAFQLRDDVLGLMGDEGTTGKRADDDLREGKCTVVILEALRRASGCERSVIEAALGDPDVGCETVALVREIVTTTGALASVENEIHDLLVVATKATTDLPSPAREALVALADHATCRQR
jgi:geranylgeranyl diphosphate synthase type I